MTSSCQLTLNFCFTNFMTKLWREGVARVGIKGLGAFRGPENIYEYYTIFFCLQFPPGTFPGPQAHWHYHLGFTHGINILPVGIVSDSS